MDEKRGSQGVEIGYVPPEAGLGARPTAPAFPDSTHLLILGDIAHAVWWLPPRIRVQNLNRQERRIFVDSIRQARELDPDDVADFHSALSEVEKRLLLLAHRHGGVDWAEYMILRSGGADKKVSLMLAMLAKQAVDAGEITIPQK